MLSIQQLASTSAAVTTKPNIVWFLTDDQDQMLGGSFPELNGVGPMPQTKALMANAGTTASNWYIHTPICSPSRSELVTGRYFHNIKAVGASKGYCSGMHINYTVVNNATFARTLQEGAGYTVGMFGKYLNEMPNEVPPGFDAWLANGGGDYIAPSFQTKNINGLPDGHWTGTSDNYSTAVIGNVSMAWIRKVATESPSTPFMAYIAPKAAHEPFIPAPWHLDFWDPSWPATEPRTPNWNISAAARADHHGNIATEPMLTTQVGEVITDIFKNRWRTLMSVDDVIASVIGEVESLGLLSTTYFFYSSDHGFQLGQFNIPMDKRHVYEWDTKIHLLVRGPGIKPGSTMAFPGTQVDIAPTFLGLAGLPATAVMDGRSIVPLLLSSSSDDESLEAAILPATREHIAAVTKRDVAAYRATWRTEVFIEYYYCLQNIKCVETCAATNPYPNADADCGNLNGGLKGTNCWTPVCTTNCYPTEDNTNNFIALRSLGGKGTGDNTLYAEFKTGDLTDGDVVFDSTPDYVEMYDLDTDPWELKNLAASSSAAEKAVLHAKLQQWYHCKGTECL